MGCSLQELPLSYHLLTSLPFLSSLFLPNAHSPKELIYP